MVGVMRGVVGETRGSVLSVSHGELLTRGKIIIIIKKSEVAGGKLHGKH